MSDQKVRVDMHMHTEYSRDSRQSLSVFAAAAERAGLNVVCVTDHDTVEGALRLREMNTPLRVIVGEEIYTRDGELIGLFLDRAVPPGLPLEESIARIREQGGIAYVPHPFSRNRLRHVRRSVLERAVPLLDAIEVFNAREAFAADNARALAFAVRHGLPGGAGSDAHRPNEIGRAYVEIPDFTTRDEFLVALKAGLVSGTLSGIRAHLRTRYDVLRRWFARATKRR
jgi:predicted metal-dependent phosphoesterase TrpH